VTLELIRRIALVAIVIHALFFLDAPFLTFRQKHRVYRWREQIVLNALELNLVLLWVMAKWQLGWERRLAPPGAVLAVAVTGLVIVLGAVLFLVWAKLTLGRWFVAGFMIKEGHQLRTNGPYAITRHPLYTGIIVTLLGVALVWNSALTLAFGALFAIPLFFHSAVEEAILEEHFGDAYREYRRRVPRLVPFWPVGGKGA
jgi:protein-S-isoprenylcysteine O-methyltransferase Ste14